MSELTYHEIRSLQDPHYDDWLDLYQASFPLTEQVQISSLNRMLRAGPDIPSSSHFLVALEVTGETAALALYDDDAGGGSAALWYIAVTPDRRSRGLGTEVYREIRRRIAAHPGLRAIFLEVEDPETCTSAEERHLAERRIEFYRRHGALRLGGVAYIQSVGWQPPLPMLLMVDLPAEMPPDEVRTMAQAVFGEAVQPQGKAELL